ncbi:MAG: DUF3467 domain-containing protein [Candidatus Kariarchaeaceae archaeon]|jgi:hypothetical protein
MSGTPQPPNIKIIDQDQPANVATEFHVMHTPNEFLLTIIEVIPQMGYKLGESSAHPGKKIPQLQTTGIVHKVVGRFGMSPATFKKMVSVANQNLKQYENKFGEVAINPPEGLQ